MRRLTMPTVIVLGGGVAGLTVAHELVTRGFEVVVYERRHEWGGKARSFGARGTATPGHRDLPAEHGFRFFPGFYKHVTDTMRRIPFGDGSRSAFDNLVPTLEITIAQADGRPQVKVPARFPESMAEWQAAFDDVRHRADLGVSHDEMKHFTGKLLDIFTACDARRFATYEYTAQCKSLSPGAGLTWPACDWRRS